MAKIGEDRAQWIHSMIWHPQTIFRDVKFGMVKVGSFPNKTMYRLLCLPFHIVDFEAVKSPPRGGYVFVTVCLSVCLSVCPSVCLSVFKITQKLLDGFSWNFVGMWGLLKGRDGTILVMLRNEPWNLDQWFRNCTSSMCHISKRNGHTALKVL